MRSVSVGIALFALALVSSGCATSAPQDRAHLQMASDLSCPSEQVTITSLDDNKYSASGCGRYVTYENYGPRTLASLRIRR